MGLRSSTTRCALQRNCHGDAAGIADERPLGTWDQRVEWDRAAPIRNRRGNGRDHGRARRLLRLAFPSGGRDHYRQAGLDHRFPIVRQRVPERDVPAGQAFIERPGEVDQVINAGTGSYVLLVTFPRVPPGESARTDEPSSGACPGL